MQKNTSRPGGLALQVQDLTVRKSSLTLLEQVSFTVWPGEFIAVMGPNGAGKTTLLKAIVGERPYGGAILINNEDIYADPEKWFRRIGFVPVDNVLHTGLTVIQALSYVGKLRGLSRPKLKERIEQRFQQFGLGNHFKQRLISKLSSGEKKKVNIIAELLTNPQMLLLDEPTSNLDMDAVKDLMELLGLIAQSGTTVLTITHSHIGLEYCHRAFFIGNSKIVYELNNSQLRRMHAENWIEVFGQNKTADRKRTSPPKRKKSAPTQPVITSKSPDANKMVTKSGLNWQHYFLLLRRQLRLLFWRPLWGALMLGPIAGVLLALVLPNGALIYDEKRPSGLEASDASQAAFLIGLVALLVGLIGAFREISKERHIYQHERRKGLDTKAYLLSKFTIFGVTLGIIAPLIIYIILEASQNFPVTALIYQNSGYDILTVLILSSVAGVSLGLLISSMDTGSNLDTYWLGAVVIANALLSGLVKNKSLEEIIDGISVLMPSRWAMEGLYTSTQIYCWGANQDVQDHFSSAHLSAVWGALMIQILVALALAFVLLRNQEKWFSSARRFRQLFSLPNIRYGMVTSMLVIGVLFLFKITQQAHAHDMRRDDGSDRLSLINLISASHCAQEEDVDTLSTAPAVASTSTAVSTDAQLGILAPTETPISTPISTPAPSIPGIPQEPQASLSEPANLLFSPRVTAPLVVNAPAGIQLTLLSRTEPADGKWLRVSVTDGAANQDYVGWVDASSGLLANEIRKVGVNLKIPPACAPPIASTYQGMTDFSPTTGQLGRWVSNNNIDISIVIDIFRDTVGTESESFRLNIVRDPDGAAEVVRTAEVRSQRKRFLLKNEVHNITVNQGDLIELTIESPSGAALSAATLNDLHGHVSIYHVPAGCEFKDR